MSPLAFLADLFVSLNLLKENTTRISFFRHSSLLSNNHLQHVASVYYVGQFRTSPSALKYVLCGGTARCPLLFPHGL